MADWRDTRIRRIAKSLLVALLILLVLCFKGFNPVGLWAPHDKKTPVSAPTTTHLEPNARTPLTDLPQTPAIIHESIPPPQTRFNPVESQVALEDIDRTTNLIRNLKTNYRILPLLSRLDFWGLPVTIEFPDLRTFNPTVMALPYPGEDRNATYVILARDEYKYGYVNGYMYQPRTIFAGLLHFELADKKRRWNLREPPKSQVHDVLMLEKLIHSHDTYFPKCEPDPDGGLGSIQGPEDPRLFWSHIGEPLIIYQSISPANSELCRHFYIVDLRSIYPAVVDIIADTVNPPPIRFKESVPISYSGQSGFHKNWAAFTDTKGDVYIHTHLCPQTIFKLTVGNPDTLPNFDSPPYELLNLQPVIRYPDSTENCVTIAWRGLKKRRIHQSTPFLNVVLCRSENVLSGACDPDDPKNQIYMSMIHAQHVEPEQPNLYEPRIITINSTYPFNYISISKPLVFCMVTLVLAQRSPFY
jgi:hypothetical protein